MNCEICQQPLKRTDYMYYCENCKSQFIFIKRLRDEVMAYIREEKDRPVISIKQETQKEV